MCIIHRKVSKRIIREGNELGRITRQLVSVFRQVINSSASQPISQVQAMVLIIEVGVVVATWRNQRVEVETLSDFLASKRTLGRRKRGAISPFGLSRTRGDVNKVSKVEWLLSRSAEAVCNAPSRSRHHRWKICMTGWRGGREVIHSSVLSSNASWSW